MDISFELSQWEWEENSWWVGETNWLSCDKDSDGLLQGKSYADESGEATLEVRTNCEMGVV